MPRIDTISDCHKFFRKNVNIPIVVEENLNLLNLYCHRKHRNRILKSLHLFPFVLHLQIKIINTSFENLKARWRV